MDKIQERALRFIQNDFQSSSEVLLSLTGAVPLHIKMMKSMACEVFKMVNDFSPKYIQDMVNIKVSNYNFRNDQQATLPKVNSTSYGLKSFRYEAARIWNSFPNNIRGAESYCQFKRLIRSRDGINCKCSSCSVKIFYRFSFSSFRFCFYFFTFILFIIFSFKIIILFQFHSFHDF